RSQRPAEVVRRRWHYLDRVARLQSFACPRTRFWLAVEYRLADPNSVDWRSNINCLGSCRFPKTGGRKRVDLIMKYIGPHLSYPSDENGDDRCEMNTAIESLASRRAKTCDDSKCPRSAHHGYTWRSGVV